MRYEKHLKEIANNTEKVQSLLQEYTDIRIRLEKVLYDEAKSVLYADMVKLIVKISDHILKSEEAVKKGVNSAMGGKVLELESERLMRVGKAEGRAEAVERLLKKGFSVEQISNMLDFDVDFIKHIEENLLISQ